MGWSWEQQQCTKRRNGQESSPSKRSAISVSNILNSSVVPVRASLPIFSPAHWKARSNFLVNLDMLAVYLLLCEDMARSTVGLVNPPSYFVHVNSQKLASSRDDVKATSRSCLRQV